MSRPDFDSSRLRRMRRITQRHGLTILTTKKLDSKVVDGGYMLSLDETRKVILGDRPLPYSASLDVIEKYLDALESGETE